MPTDRTQQTPRQVYIAGPLFSEGEKRFNARLCRALEHLNLTVFLPQRDGYESALLRQQGVAEEEIKQKIFNLDCAQIAGCHIVIACLDGAVPDWGMAYGQGKKIFGLRTGRHNHTVGAMLEGSTEKAFYSISSYAAI